MALITECLRRYLGRLQSLLPATVSSRGCFVRLPGEFVGFRLFTGFGDSVCCVEKMGDSLYAETKVLLMKVI